MLFCCKKLLKKFLKKFVVTIDITTRQVYNIVVIKKVTTNRFTFSLFKIIQNKNFSTQFSGGIIMKIAVVCANGKAGQLITKEAVNRGFDVTAFVRGENKSAAKNTVTKDLFDITKEDLNGFDVVVDACGGWTAETIPVIPKAGEYLCNLLAGTDTRLVIVGGAGSLYVNPEHTITVADGKDFPDAFKPLAAAHQVLLDGLRKRNDVKWTYVSPTGDFQADGERTGEYTLGGEELVLNSKGESVISYADYSIAFVDEIANGNHIGERISVVSK